MKIELQGFSEAWMKAYMVFQNYLQYYTSYPADYLSRGLLPRYTFGGRAQSFYIIFI